MKSAIKGVAIVLLCVAAVSMYPDIARYIKIKTM